MEAGDGRNRSRGFIGFLRLGVARLEAGLSGNSLGFVTPFRVPQSKGETRGWPRGPQDLRLGVGEAASSHTLFCFRPWLSRPKKVFSRCSALCIPTSLLLSRQPIPCNPTCILALAIWLCLGLGRSLAAGISPDCGTPRSYSAHLPPCAVRLLAAMLAGSVSLCCHMMRVQVADGQGVHFPSHMLFLEPPPCHTGGYRIHR